MKFAVLYSKQDLAGLNIAKQLKNHFLPQALIIEMKKDSIYSENIDRDQRLKGFDFLIFATKHQSKALIPSLSIHAPGNWRNADYGGKQGRVCMTSALALKYLFQKLNENSKNLKTEHEITLEATHHGPYLELPCCFIEIGSNEKSWENEELGKVIAKTIADFQNFEKWKQENKQIKPAIGIGGPHYCPNFNKIQLSDKSNIAISHIIPEYSLPLTESMIKEAVEKTQEQTNLIILDWKGIGKSEERQQTTQLLSNLGLEYERIERIEK